MRYDVIAESSVIRPLAVAASLSSLYDRALVYNDLRRVSSPRGMVPAQQQRNSIENHF